MSRTFTRLIREVAVLMFVFTAALSVNYAFGAWNNPSAPPPGNNTPAPLNAGPDWQVKEGAIDMLRLKITDQWPLIYFHDTTPGHFDSRIISDGGDMYLQLGNNDVVEPPWTTALYLDSVTANFSGSINAPGSINASQNVNANGYVWSRQFWGDNLGIGGLIDGPDVRAGWRVRTNWYCDVDGNNCINPWNIQPKVWGSCPAGKAIAQIYGDGNVRCEDVGGGGACPSYTHDGCQTAPLQCPNGQTQVGGKWSGGKCSENNDWQYVECRPNSC